MNITAAMVKELRERTGSGMMECKRALVDAGGDIEAAIADMRKAGLAKADKKSARTASEGCVTFAFSEDNKKAAMVEINSETDFVAKSDHFKQFASQVANVVLNSDVATVEELLVLAIGESGDSIEEARRHLVAKLGEKIDVRRFNRCLANDGVVGSYLHGTKIGVLVELTGGDSELGKDIAMHIAASHPICVEDKDVPQELVAKEREIFMAQAEQSGKPKEIIEKMIAGKIKKFIGEITLLNQPFVKNPNVKISDLLKQQGASVSAFCRFEVGEGIDKKDENFAEEVMAQVRGA